MGVKVVGGDGDGGNHGRDEGGEGEERGDKERREQVVVDKGEEEQLEVGGEGRSRRDRPP